MNGLSLFVIVVITSVLDRLLGIHLIESGHIYFRLRHLEIRGLNAIRRKFLLIRLFIKRVRTDIHFLRSEVIHISSWIVSREVLSGFHVLFHVDLILSGRMDSLFRYDSLGNKVLCVVLGIVDVERLADIVKLVNFYSLTRSLRSRGILHSHQLLLT